MVLRGKMMTTRPDRSKTLHNFTLPNLKWGSQRYLKCMKIDSTSSSATSSGDHRLRRRSPPSKFAGSSVSIPFRFSESDHRSKDNNEHHRLRSVPFKSEENGGEEEGIEEFRVKIMSDLKTERDKITQSMLRKDTLVENDQERRTEESGKEKEKEKEISPAKPWNLRKRRATCKEPEPVSVNQLNSWNQINKGFVVTGERIVNPSPFRNDSTRVKERGRVVEAEEMMMMKTKLSVELSKKEIEEDYMAMVGHRPPRRPKKRPRTVKKILDNLYPGLYLTEVTLDAYKV